MRAKTQVLAARKTLYIGKASCLTTTVNVRGIGAEVLSKSSSNESHSDCTELLSCPPPTLSPLCSLFSPTPFQTQTFSLYLWRASLGKWQPLNDTFHNVRLGIICPALSLSLRLSLSQFPLLLLTCLLSTSQHFAQHFSLFTFFPPHSLSLSGWALNF